MNAWQIVIFTILIMGYLSGVIALFFLTSDELNSRKFKNRVLANICYMAILLMILPLIWIFYIAVNITDWLEKN